MNVVFCKWDEEPIRHFLDRGAAMILVVDRSDVTWAEMPDELLAAMVRVYEVESTDSIDEMTAVSVDIALSGLRVDRVVASHEQALYGASLLSQRLGVDPDALAVVSGVRDKRDMKARVERAGLRVARYGTITARDGAAELAALAERVGFPMVVKPVNGMATIATVRVHDAAELHKVVTEFDYGPGGIRSRQLVAEESLSGHEYHVDAVWRDDEPWVFAVSRYFCPRLVLNEEGGVNGSYILAERDHPELYARTRELHVAANAALGIRRGITHLEMFRTPGCDELTFSEVAWRTGGGGAITVVAHKYGPSLNAVWAEETMDGERDRLPWKAEAPFPYVGWLNVTPEASGVITALPATEELLRHPNVLAVEPLREVGSPITLAHPSVWCLFIVIGTETEEEMVRLAEELNRNVRIEVEPAPA
ncbi:ATP-grasp domain-containing protein [Micromonospora sp. URMC 107]|uniref:ATP-grasp domain-containing protein n=1 Tax=Micromonospora sp. URMC 107 TaxID=3423418 RepID=UPI003F19E4DB